MRAAPIELVRVDDGRVADFHYPPTTIRYGIVRDYLDGGTFWFIRNTFVGS
jgi:hypothetical protein